MPMHKQLVEELEAQLEMHDDLVVLNSTTGEEVQVTDVRYDFDRESIVIWVN